MINKNAVYISEEDYNLLKEYTGTSNNVDEMSLAYELSRAIILPKNQLPEGTVQLYSSVIIEETAGKKQTTFTVVMPSEVNIREKRISILSPMASAIIGFKKGDSVTWKMPGGLKTLKIISVSNPVDIPAC